MVDTEDVQQYSTKFQNQLEKLAASDIPEADRRAIKACIDELRADADIGTGTLVGHLNRLRLSAERADTPLTEMDKADYTAFLTALETEYDLSEGTRRNYRKALKKLMEYREVEWLDEITIGVAPDRTVDPNDLLSMEEIDAMIDAATHTRDKALLAAIADSGLRISAVTSLRKRDFQRRSGEGAIVTPNTDAPVKDATDPVPLTWSAGYVANWLDVHPRDDPDAALFHKLEHVGEDEDGALTYQYAARRIKRIADDAGIDRERVTTHAFRKSAISRWIREGLPEQVIKHRASWAEDSGQFEIYYGERRDHERGLVE
ncbi:MAG: tyrosine-type recombinase/integrase [Halobacteriales archaeon]